MSSISTRSYGGSYLAPAFEHATVADAMHPGVLACEPDASPRELARMMATHHVHCIAVMGVSHEGSGESLTWGIVSDQDLLQVAVRGGSDQSAHSLSRQPIVSVGPAMPLREAGELMISRGVNHVLVIDPDNQHPVGVLSTLDVAGVVAWGEG
jgi:CBS domain-containing protein